MISSVVPYIDTVLGLSLIATAAAIHFRPQRRRHRVRIRVPGPSRHLPVRLRSLPVPLATAGVLLMLLGWFWPEETAEDPAVSPLAPIETPLDPANATGHGVVLVRGTPSDDDSASEEDIRSYSQRLGTLIAQALARPPLALHLEARPIGAEEWKAIRDDPSQAREWCAQGDGTAFVAAIGIAAVHLEYGAGYAPWREPEYVILSCETARHASLRGRVDERLGDRIPYEQAITDDFRSALSRVATRPD